MGSVPNGSKWIGPEIGPDGPSVYTGPLWNRSVRIQTDPKLVLLFCMSNFESVWICTGPVPNDSLWIGAERFLVNRSRSGRVRFRTVLVRSHVIASRVTQSLRLSPLSECLTRVLNFKTGQTRHFYLQDF